jgi:nickel-dependent lactate racemase
MVKIKLPYGKDFLYAELPENRLKGVLISKSHIYRTEKAEKDIVEYALNNPIDSPRLKDLVKNKTI